MKRDEILNMPADQQMDMLISEKIFNHSVDEWNREFFANRTAYSTDIAAAWRIVEKMRKEWPDYFIGNSDDERVQWQVTWGYDGHGWENVNAETAPLAICRAALLATMDKK